MVYVLLKSEWEGGDHAYAAFARREDAEACKAEYDRRWPGPQNISPVRVEEWAISPDFDPSLMDGYTYNG